MAAAELGGKALIESQPVKWSCPLFGSVLWLLASSRLAHAGSEGCSGSKPWVAVSGDVPAAFADAVRSDLRAGLAPSGIEVCETADATAPDPLARVVIRHGVGGGSYGVDVTDSVTKKRLGRDLSLDELPADGRSFALAVAAEELLRASWAELALRGVHSAETTAPPEVRAIVEEQRPAATAPKPRSPMLGARVAFEHFLGGQTHFGGDVLALLPFGKLASGFIALGGRRALTVDAPHGTIQASAAAAELGLSVTAWRAGTLELGALASARALWLRFEPRASSGNTESAQSGLAVTSRLGVSVGLGRPGRLRSYTSTGVGLPLQAFSAADSGSIVTGASRLELFASTGLSVELP